MFDIVKFCKQFDKEYDFLYEHHNCVPGYEEAVDYFDHNHHLYADIVKAYIEYRHDFISSDREAAAFSFSLEALNLFRDF